MFVNAIKKAKEAIFPIFLFRKDEKGIVVGVAGTGFFISPDGHFVTVAHIWDGLDEKTNFFYHGLLPDNVHNPKVEIEIIASDDDNDVVIGKVNFKPHSYFALAKDIPDEGRTVCISGYPMAKISMDAKKTLQLGGVRRYFQPTFVLDIGQLKSKSNTGKVRKHDGFLVRDAGLFGMSGGPVFGVDGEVFGVQGSVNTRESKSGAGKKIVVENGVVIRSGLVIELANKNDIHLDISE